MSAIRGFAIVIVIAIIILFFWCFIFGKCSGRGFGTVPPRPITSRTTSEGRRRSDDDDNNNADDLQVSGSGSGGTGASGSGRGRIQERLQVSGSGSGGSGASGRGSGTSEVGDPCAGKSGFDWLSCKASQGFKNITEGKTIFGAPHPGYVPRVGVVPIPLGRMAVIIA